MSRRDMDIVLDEAIKGAIYFLGKHGEFFPFAVVCTQKGGLHHVQAWTDEQKPDSDSVIELLRSGLRNAAVNHAYRTIAIISLVRLRDRKTDEVVGAIRAEIEDVEADPLICYLPYVVANKRVKIGEMKAEIGSRIIFAKGPRAE